MVGGIPVNNKHIILILAGVVGLIVSIALRFGGMDFILGGAVKLAVRLVPGTPVWEMWRTLPVPIYLKVHIFNVTNADDLPFGAKPMLKEMGPYTYLVDFEKFDFTIDEIEDTVKYRQNRTYYFVPEMSNGSEDDVVTFINLVFVGVSHLAHGFTDIDFILETLDGMLVEKGETLTITSTVRQFLFDGVSIQAYVDLINDPLVQSSSDVQLPEQFADGKFAVFKGQNGTDAGWWVVKSGITNFEDFGRVVSVDSKTKLDFWQDESCNALNGTDGTIYQSFIQPGETKLQLFASEICRSLSWAYYNETVTEGVPVFRHILPNFLSVPEDPDLWCFCPKKEPMECNVTGIGSVAPCYGGAPLTYSKPHFLAVDESVANTVGGLSPDPLIHESWVDLHGLTGSPVQAFVRLQLSIELINWPAMPTFANASRALVPFAWIEQTATLDSFNIGLIIVLETYIKIFPVFNLLCILAGLALIGGGGTLIYKSRNSNLVTELQSEIVNVKPDLGQNELKF